MNLIAHTHVALALGAVSPPYLLGAVVPDLATMAQVRVDRSRLPEGVAQGFRCHVATDVVFHDDATFRDGSRAVARDLAAVGIERWAARAVGHVGWELMLDGTLLGSPAHAAYLDALELGEMVAGAVDGADRARWDGLLSWRGRMSAPGYDDPAWIAERLVHILGPYPRLRLGPEQVPVVADVLARHRAAVESVATAVLAATAQGAGDHLRRETVAGAPPAP